MIQPLLPNKIYQTTGLRKPSLLPSSIFKSNTSFLWILFHDCRAVVCTREGYEWGIHRAQLWTNVTMTPRMPECLPQRVFLLEPGPVSRSGSGAGHQPQRTSECSRITIPIGQAALSWSQCTVFSLSPTFFEDSIGFKVLNSGRYDCRRSRPDALGN